METKKIIQLVNENSETKKIGVSKGSVGIIVEKESENKFLVAFLDFKQNKAAGLASVYSKDMKIYEENKNLSSENEKIGYLDTVQLINEKEKYSKKLVFKGEIGVVVETNPLLNESLVDFSKVDENGNVYGDCLSVESKDLKILRKGK